MLGSFRHAARDVDFGRRLETFFVTAVATVLVIRTQLWLTNYPQLGGHGLHIAHLLYGGIFMVIAIWLLLVYVNRSLRGPAAIAGGVGFGFFIDELGKFVTSDNNYFFKPAAALIYLIFVGLFLAIRALQRRRGLTPTESVVNAISLLAGAATRELNERDRARALAILEAAPADDPLVGPARELLRHVEALPVAPPSRADRAVAWVRDRYLALVAEPVFVRVASWVIGLWGALSLVATIELVLSVGLGVGRGDAFDHLTFVNIASVASSTASAVLALAGIRRLARGDRRGAYREFERALLISIFVTRAFSFVESQFGACFGVAVDVLLYVTVRLMDRGEEHARAAVGPAPDGGSVLGAADSQLAVGQLRR